MSYIGTKPANAALTASDITDGIISTVKVTDDAVTLAKMASGTDGNLITYDASGNPAAVATGTSGHFLKSQGAGSVPVFAAAAAGGKLLQAVTGTSSSASQGSETSFTDTGLNVTITPSATSSKILVMAHTTGLVSSNGSFVYFTIERQISGGSNTNIGDSSIGLTHLRGDPTQITSVMCHALDSPSTTSAVTYEFQRRVSANSGAAMYQGVKSNITVLEIGA